MEFITRNLLDNWSKNVWKICITVQLSHYPSKFGPGVIYQLMYLEPLDLAIEASLVEDGGGG